MTISNPSLLVTTIRYYSKPFTLRPFIHLDGGVHCAEPDPGDL